MRLGTFCSSGTSCRTHSSQMSKECGEDDALLRSAELAIHSARPPRPPRIMCSRASHLFPSSGQSQCVWSEQRAPSQTYSLILSRLCGLFEQFLDGLDVHFLVYLFEDLVPLLQPMQYGDLDQGELDGRYLRKDPISTRDRAERRHDARDDPSSLTVHLSLPAAPLGTSACGGPTRHGPCFQPPVAVSLSHAPCSRLLGSGAVYFMSLR